MAAQDSEERIRRWEVLLESARARLGVDRVNEMLWPIQSEAMRLHYGQGMAHDDVDLWYEKKLVEVFR